MRKQASIPSFLLVLGLIACAWPARGAVTASEASTLKNELTPLGGIRAGNKEGTIPAWTGGLTTKAQVKGKRPDPFKDEKPVLTITSKNMDQYVDKLTDGTKALLKKYPDTYRLDVYPTHRTAAAPQWVYDNVFRNATQASLVEGSAGLKPTGAFGGIPFPIPKNGMEVVWNHALAWHGESVRGTLKGYQNSGGGHWINTVVQDTVTSLPYYYKETKPEKFAETGNYWEVYSRNSGPPIRAGEGVVGVLNLDEGKSQSWTYLTGQRRTRKLPSACCDSPSPFSAGITNFDETGTFSGRADRFEWKLIGKQEMYIPYNANKIELAPSDAAVLGNTNHLNPDYVRWELHRVWVVEATLKPGQRHVSPKGRYYFDEDTGIAVIGDRWDAQGQLSRHVFSLVATMPEIPASALTIWGVYDMISGQSYVNGLVADQRASALEVERPPASLFTSEGLAGSGIR